MITKKDRVHYPGLDVLRGIAIILVMLYHYVPSFRLGWIGVDLFFVLSGFLITSILLRHRGRKDFFTGFFMRRGLRILPLYLLVVGAFYLALPYVFDTKEAGSVYNYYSQHQVWFWTFLQNWLFIFRGTPPEPYLEHLWSLGVEEQFYLLWPLLIFLIPQTSSLKKAMWVIFLMALLLRCLGWYFPPGHDFNYYSTLTRCDGLAAGSLLAVMQAEGRKPHQLLVNVSGIAFTLLALTAFVLPGGWEHDNALMATVGYSILALFFSLLCWRALHKASQGYGLAHIGRISYGLYMFHLPVFLVTGALLNRWMPAAGSMHTAMLVISSTAITFIAATMSYYLIELPILRLRNRLA